MDRIDESSRPVPPSARSTNSFDNFALEPTASPALTPGAATRPTAPVVRRAFRAAT
jgi:hypothetical protein